ncbi:MAG: hypothetical protein LUE98_09200 [Tannerellaceae bacterium]|nr:hypothetical protein [Tannerellaceae bacterium]
MKNHLFITKILFFPFLTFYSFVSFAQGKELLITIQQDSITLREVFVQIEQQTSYAVAYEQTGLEADRKKRSL